MLQFNSYLKRKMSKNYYRLCKSRILKRSRVSQSDSDENEDPSKKCFNSSSAGSTSEFDCSPSNNIILVENKDTDYSVSPEYVKMLAYLGK